MSTPLTFDEIKALETCESEPIRTPECTQPHGCVVVCDAALTKITHISANCADFFAITPDSLLGQHPSAAFSSKELHDLRNAISLRTSSNQREYLGTIETDCGAFAGASHRRDDYVIVELTKVQAREQSERIDIERLRWLTPRWSSEIYSLSDALDVIVGDLRAVVGYDRVMAYRFRPDLSGEVVAESLAPGTESFLGLRFPASDIPKIARQICLDQPIRLICDIEAEDNALLALDETLDLVDMTLTELRGTSKVHIKYLSNMGVGASLVLPVVIDGELWGMFSCHHRTQRTVSLRESLSFELIGQMINMHLSNVLTSELKEHVERCKDIVKHIPCGVSDHQTEHISQIGWETAAPQIAKLLKADGLYLVWGAEQASYGQQPTHHAFMDEDNTLPALSLDGVFATDKLADQPNVPPSEHITGMMRIELAPNNNVFLWVFRKEETETIKWAGSPKKEIMTDGVTTRLLPRSSFAAFIEQSKGQSRAWDSEDLTFVKALKDALADIIDVEIERKEHHKKLHLVVQELNHRVLNTLALIQSLVRQSSNLQSDVSGFAKALDGRITSLASAHQLLTGSRDFGLEISEAMAQELAPFSDGRAILTGPKSTLKFQAATIFVLVFHEMVANSAKYGALSTEHGWVDIHWGNFDDVLALTWKECGGPPVSPPTTTGFGQTLITEAIPHQLDGTSEIIFAPDGVEINLTIPLNQVKMPALDPEASLSAGNSASPATEEAEKRILVLEDNYLIGSEIRAAVSQVENVAGILARNNKTAIELLQQDQFDGAILDLNLEGEDSFETAKYLEKANIPFGFLTGYSTEFSWIKLFGDKPFLQKPLNQAMLIKLVKQLCATKPKSAALTILILEDSMPLQRQLMTDIESVGHRVICANSTDEAIQVLVSERIDAIILDIFIHRPETPIPDATLRIVSRIRHDPDNTFQVDQDVPILAISGGLEIEGGYSSLKTARQIGVDHCLKKPFATKDLFAWIETVEQKYLNTKTE